MKKMQSASLGLTVMVAIIVAVTMVASMEHAHHVFDLVPRALVQ